MPTVNPYLAFNGNCEEAFNFYKSVFGTEFQNLQRFGDMPSEFPMPDSAKDKILHVALPMDKGSVLMGSDSQSSFGGPEVTCGSNMTVSLATNSEEETKKLFDGLSAGGKVTMPLEKTFWNAYFGMFTDKYGIQWMVNYDLPKQ